MKSRLPALYGGSRVTRVHTVPLFSMLWIIYRMAILLLRSEITHHQLFFDEVFIYMPELI
jgi:hypothetical protein